MPSLLMIALFAQTQVSAIPAHLVEAALDALVPESRIIDGRSLGERPLFLDGRRTTASFSAADLGDRAVLGRVARTYATVSEATATVCTVAIANGAPARSCEMRDDGVHFSVVSARASPELPGAYLMTVRVLFTRTWPGGTRSLFGGDHDVRLTLVDGVWKVTILAARVT